MLLMGWDSLIFGDIDSASSWFERALAMAESHGESVQRSHALVTTGIGRWRRGEIHRSEQLLRQGLRLSRALNDRWMVAQSLEVLAWCAESTKDFRRAAVLMAAASAGSPAAGSPLLPFFAGLHDECKRRSRDELGGAEFEAAWNEGNALSYDQAVVVGMGDIVSSGRLEAT